MKIRCCRECVPPKRHPGCHSRCEEYIAEKARLDERREKVALEITKESELRDYDVRRHERAKKKHGR